MQNIFVLQDQWYQHNYGAPILLCIVLDSMNILHDLISNILRRYIYIL